ncbi:MAG: DUF2017 family protein [Ilumatobacter sp.]|nr:DUF2017 family protein [Ilumatobacter sp.]
MPDRAGAGGHDDERDADFGRDSDDLDDRDDLDDADDVLLEPPVRRSGESFEVAVGPDEVAVIQRLIGELRAMLAADDPGDEATALLARLFPVAYPHDDEMEAEYQRLMREELVQSKLRSFDVVDEVLTAEGPVDEARLVALMQSVNSIRLVLGALLDVSDDPDAPEVAPGYEDSPEYALYGYLSWLLEWCVRAVMSTA